jgi:hypothetical protein
MTQGLQEKEVMCFCSKTHVGSALLEDALITATVGRWHQNCYKTHDSSCPITDSLQSENNRCYGTPWSMTRTASRECACFRSGPTECHSASLIANTVGPMRSSQSVSYIIALNLSFPESSTSISGNTKALFFFAEPKCIMHSTLFQMIVFSPRKGQLNAHTYIRITIKGLISF